MFKKTLLIALTTLLFAGSAFSADTQQGVFVLDDFAGGLAEKQSPFSLKPSQATTAENVRLDNPWRAISRRKNLRVYGTADFVESITGIYRHYMSNGDKVLLAFHGDEIEKGTDSSGAFTNILNLTTGDHKWSCVTWHDVAICSDGYNQPIKYDGSSASATYLGAPLATVLTTGTGPDTGTHSYKVSCYNGAEEIILNTPSNTITGTGKDVTLSMIPVCPDTLLTAAPTGRKIYRTKANASTYYLLTGGTIANNTAVTLADSETDAEVTATVYPAGDATWKPPVGKFPLIQNNRLFFANDPTNNPSRLWYGSEGSHDIFDTYNESGYFDIRKNDGDAITFIRGNLGILTVGKNNTIQKIYIDGSDPDADWSIGDPLSYVGCQAPFTAVNSPLGILYLGKDGLYRFNGQYSELISESVTPTIQDISQTDLENVVGVFHNNFYHMAYRSSMSGEAFNNRVLVLDLLAKAYTIDLLNINAFTALNSGNDFGILYAGSSTSGDVYAYSSSVNEIVHKRHSDFTGLFDDMRYIPTSVGGNTESPVFEIARTETIDEMVGIINDQKGVIDRQDYIGHYTSQPIYTGATSYDKLYWNEVVPSGSVTLQLRTSATGEKNLLHNDSFEYWDNGPYQPTSVEEPNDWAYSVATVGATGAAATASTTEVNVDTYSAKLTKPNTGTTVIARAIPNASNYAGKSMVFSSYIKSANSVAQKVWIDICQNISGTGSDIRTRNFYANGGAWEKVSTSTTISATATSITVKCAIGSEANAVAYFDQVMMIEGSTAQNDWSAWSTALTNSAGSDVSGITTQDYVQYVINLTTSDITLTPTIVKQNGYNVYLTYNREGTAQSTNIPINYETGWLDMGQPLYPKALRYLECYHDGTEGTLTIEVENFEGDTDTFDINLTVNPKRYKQAFTTGALMGKLFKVNITNTGIKPLTISKILISYDVQPDQGDFT